MSTGRNDPCACGSGRKFKRCCGQRAADGARAVSPATLDPQDPHGCLSLIRERRYPELELAARRLLAAKPDAGIGWKLLGVALAQQNKDALPALERAAALLPEDPEAQCNLGNALRRGGRLEEAAASHRRALAVRPDYAEGHNNLGAVLRDLGCMEDAIASYRQAIAIKPRFALAGTNLGSALAAAGRPAEAAEHLRKALGIDPGLTAAYAALATVLLDLGRPEEAADCYRRALRLRPDAADFHNNLGNILLEIGQPEQAAASYRRAVALQADFAAAHSNLGSALRDLGRTEEAVASFQRALELQPTLAEVHNNLSIVLRLLHRHEQAEISARRAHALAPALAGPLVSLARLEADRGLFSEAEALLQRALSLDPDSAEACSAFVGLRKMTREGAWLANAERILGLKLPLRQQTHLHYALGKYFDDIGDFARAAVHYRQANVLKQRYSVPYDRAQSAELVSRVIRSHGREWPGSPGEGAATAVRPVFIVGMPRSGTSLAEQILASHPDIFGAGELAYWGQALAGWLAEPPAGTTERGRRLRALADGYLALLGNLATGVRHVVDKMPMNFMALGLIHAALPGARIIHMRRHPIDTCLSIHFQDFDAGYPYAHDHADLVHYYREYSRVMEHWRTVLPPGAMLEVPYEELASDPETWTRRMLEFLGAEWDPGCLNFHRTRRAVITASRWQVRQPISRSSVGRWRNYEPHLGALMDLMAEPSQPDPQSRQAPPRRQRPA